MTLATEIGAISVRIGADISELTQGLDAASRAVSDTAAVMDTDLSSFAGSASGIFTDLGDAMGRAALGGKTSFRDMAESILADLSRIGARTFIGKPLEGLVDGLLGSLSFGGARAAGGPVGPGAAYLVGEQGPELFVPREAGRIMPNGRVGGITVNIYAQDAQSVVQSETQIAAMLARASRRGQRNL